MICEKNVEAFVFLVGVAAWVLFGCYRAGWNRLKGEI